MSQTHQRNGVLRRFAKGRRDVQNAARAAEKNATIGKLRNFEPLENFEILKRKIKIKKHRKLRKLEFSWFFFQKNEQHFL